MCKDKTDEHKMDEEARMELIRLNHIKLQTCSRCKSEIDISYFGMDRKKEPYKTCDNCRTTINKKVTQHHHCQIMKIHHQQQKQHL